VLSRSRPLIIVSASSNGKEEGRRGNGGSGRKSEREGEERRTERDREKEREGSKGGRQGESGPRSCPRGVHSYPDDPPGSSSAVHYVRAGARARAYKSYVRERIQEEFARAGDALALRNRGKTRAPLGNAHRRAGRVVGEGAACVWVRARPWAV